MVEFSVIIVSYKKLNILIDCINSLIRFNDIGDSLEIIIVDNSPDDNIYEYIKENYPRVKIIKNKNNGFGGGNNVGASQAKGKYLLFLNPDTILIEPIFNFAINKFRDNPNLGLFGIRLLDNNLSKNLSFYYMDDTGMVKGQQLKIMNYLDIFLPDKMFTSGANIFIRKSDFDGIGRFDENYFMYFEEQDLTRRIKSIGKYNAYYSEKSLIHLEGKTTSNEIKYYQTWLDSLRHYSKKFDLDFESRLKKIYRKLKFKKNIKKIFLENTATLDEQLKIVLRNMNNQ